MELAESYHKARAHYALSSGLLLGYELIGISVASQPLTFSNVTLQDPSSIGIILVLLTIYFAVRVSIEWSQCDKRRRLHPFARMDFFVAHLIGASSLLVWALQGLLHLQILDFIGVEYIALFVLNLVLGCAITAFIFEIIDGEWKRGLHNWLTVSLFFVIIAVMSASLFFYSPGTGEERWVRVPIYLIGISLPTGVAFAISRWLRKRRAVVQGSGPASEQREPQRV